MKPLAPGAVLAGYRLVSEVARGGMGVVWLAEQAGLERRVALKVIAPELAADPSFRARFTRESRMAAHIEHPNVVPIYEASEADGRLFLAMRYVDGVDLRELMRREGPLPPARAVSTLAQVAAALDAAHDRGLVHRDVKPANVLIEGRGHVYLTDFGLTKRVEASAAITRGGEWVGTVDYIAPEQVRGEAVGARADVYSLGCVLHELVTGRVAYERDSDVAKLWAHVNEPPPSLAAEPLAEVRALDPVVARAMALRPDERFASAGELAQAAQDALAGGPATVLDPTPPPSPRPAAPAPAPTGPTAALPDAGAWSPAHPVPPAHARRSGGTAVAIVIAAALLALGGIAAAVIATGALEDDPPAEPKTTDAGGGASGSEAGADEPTTSTEAAVPDDMEPYETDTYTAQLPRGWDRVKDYELQGSERGETRYVTELHQGDATLVVDTTLDRPESLDPGDSARKLDADARSSNADYKRIGIGPETIGEHDAYVWLYAVAGERVVDIFFFTGGHGYAVLGRSAPGEFGTVRRLAERVAGSVASR